MTSASWRKSITCNIGKRKIKNCIAKMDNFDKDFARIFATLVYILQLSTQEGLASETSATYLYSCATVR